MKNLLSWVGALALAVMSFAAPAMAQTTVGAGDVYSAFLPYLLAIVGAAVSTLIGWVLLTVNKKLGISIDDSMRNSLQTAARNGAGLLLNQLGNQLQGKTIDVKSPALAEAVNYVIKAAPDALAHFGLTPEMIEQKIIALLPQVANTAAPPPVK